VKNKYEEIFNLDMSLNEASLAFFTAVQAIGRNNEGELAKLKEAYLKMFPLILRENQKRNAGGWCTQ